MSDIDPALIEIWAQQAPLNPVAAENYQAVKESGILEDIEPPTLDEWP